MGYRLAGEVLDHCPDLPYRQFRLLMVLALDATDSTRQAKPGMEKIILQSNASRRTTLHTLDALQQRGLIKAVCHAAPGVRAVYEILPLTGSGANTVAPESGANTVAPDRVPSTDQRVPFSGQSGANTVAPPKPTPKPSPKEPTGAANAAPTAQAILAAFIDWDHARGGQLTRRTIGQLAKHIGDLLGEGIAEEHIKRGLADWRDRDQYPSTLHSFVDAAMNGRPVRSRRQAERDSLAERELARAVARDAARAPKGELE